jgi:excisionase family DNA binding protein
VTVHASDFVSIGEAAILLRSSRRHVADLCARGLLPSVSVGSQRRVRRGDVESFIRPALSREQLEVLWLHRAIAGKFVENPATLLAVATINLRRMRRLRPEGEKWGWIERWQLVLDEGVEAALDALTSAAEYAVELRATSPFVGILSEMERKTVLDALAETRREQARPLKVDLLERVMRVV